MTSLSLIWHFEVNGKQTRTIRVLPIHVASPVDWHSERLFPELVTTSTMSGEMMQETWKPMLKRKETQTTTNWRFSAAVVATKVKTAL